MFKILIGSLFLIFGFWLFLGDPAQDPQSRYFGDYVYEVIRWLDDIRPWSTILCFVFAVAAFITLKKY